MYLMGAAPKDIVRALGDPGRLVAWGVSAGPLENTVKSWLRGLHRGAGTNGERWDPWADHEATRRRVAPVAAWKAQSATREEARWLTRGEALWVDRAASLLPDEPPDVLYRIARGAVDLGDDEAALRALDMELVLFASEPTPSARTLASWELLGIPRVVVWAKVQAGRRLHEAVNRFAVRYGDWHDWAARAQAAGLDAGSMTMGELESWAQEDGR